MSIRIYRYPSRAAENRLQKISRRKLVYGRKDEVAVQRIIQEVRLKGDEAVIAYVNRFDSPELSVDGLRVGEAEFRHAETMISESFRQSLDLAYVQIERFHRMQAPHSRMMTDRSGVLTGQIVHPVDVAGIYVPGGKGGKTPLVSSVLMGAIPACIAGVRRIVMTTPADRNGNIDPHLLVAASRAGVHDVFKAGSAWAIAAMAFGTERIDRCDVIVGPGNTYVTLAKKIVSGMVGIDMIAGPSEILILADSSARAEFAAADLLSQAEHDRVASAILITTSQQLAAGVSDQIEKQLTDLHRQDIAKESLAHYGAIFVVPDMGAAIVLANRIAPEHLELLVEKPFDLLPDIRHAGAVFAGHYTPEPMGDYIAGPNHVLPTAGSARFSSALSVEHFIKKTSLIYYSKEAFVKEAEHVMRLAETEGLGAHARSVAIRLEEGS
ncbi:histidinol dehydrogenase [Desulfatirhabdium butyrativorans]|uniref:histidinol dehydrogenase n=1 Tax=Desulfatirhabdium butyrativorans TaxID=340467 RepID=UPI00316AD493